jgi:capsular exopolysaccharide synthesis family protein
MNEHEFYKRSFYDKVSDYKKSIFFITFLFISLVFLYLIFASKVYKTDATLEVIPKSNLLDMTGSERNDDAAYERHFVTQMDFLRSRYLVLKVVSTLQSTIELYTNGGLKPFKRFLGEPPFYIKNLDIKDHSFHNKMFHLRVVDKDHYSLRLVPDSNILSKKRATPLIYEFSKKLDGKFMSFTIEKNEKSKIKDIYFKVQDNQKYVDRALRNLKVIKNSKESNVIKIIYEDYSPKGAQKFVNTLISEYMKLYSINQVDRTKRQLKLLDSELKGEKRRLDEVEDRLQKFVEDNKVAGIDTETKNLVNTIYKYESDLEALDLKYQNIKTVSKIFKKSYDYKDILSRISQLENKNIIKLADSIGFDEDNYKKLRQKYKNRHPNIVKIKETIAKKSITLEKNLEQVLKNIIAKREKLQNYILKYKSHLTRVPHKEIGYAKLKRERDILEKSYLLLLDKKRQINLSKKIKGDYSYRVLDFAFLPDRHSKPKKLILMPLGLILGLLFGILYALIRTYFARNITVPSEIKELTRRPYLGTIPYIKDKKLYNDVFVAKEPDSIASQMIWSLRNQIDTFKGDYETQVIAVTSMVKGEGKTTTAANLATCLGMGDKKTIVISLDLRLPELHMKFGLDNSIGLSSVLFSDKKLSDVIYKSAEYPNLSLIMSGPKVLNPMKIINSAYIEEMLDELRETYDYIILDLAPAGMAAESVFLMKKADIVISVLKSNYSEKSFVPYMESIVEQNGIKNLGFILNGVPKKYIKIIARKENKKYINYNKKHIAGLKSKITKKGLFS